ncbi:MAG: D-alanyl-D-alanine carboxypeptidase, partial [Clostridia bacterium]
SGTASTFVDGMNNKASQLGLVATHFENCTGLPALNAYSCAIDVATIMRQLIKNKNYFECAHIWMQDYLHPDGRIIGMTNTNRLVKFYNGCDGGKTGYTNEAMHCLCATAKKSNTRFISVVIGAPDSKTRFAEVSSLFNYGFSNYENKVLVNENTAFDKINVIGGKANSLTIKAEKQLEVFTKKGESNIETLYDIPDSVKAPIEVGDCVGSAKAVRNGKTVGEIKLIATESIKEKSFLDWFKELVVK